MEECKCCKNPFKQLVRHISLAKKCKAFYGEELDELKKESRKRTKANYDAKYRDLNRDKINKRQKTYDAANREEILQKKRASKLCER